MSIDPVVWYRFDEENNLCFTLNPLSKFQSEHWAWIPAYHQSTIDELQRQLTEAQEMSKEIADVAYMSGSYDARKKAEHQLAEREAVIKRLREALRVFEPYDHGDLWLLKKDIDIDDILAIPTDHTALDEAIKQATLELRKQFSIQLNAFVENVNPLLADEIRSK